MDKINLQKYKEYNQIFESDYPNMDKIAQAFDFVTRQVVDHAQNEVELFKAMGDRESLVKEQIKIETLVFARGVFAEAFKRVTGKSAWDE